VVGESRAASSVFRGDIPLVVNGGAGAKLTNLVATISADQRAIISTLSGEVAVRVCIVQLRVTAARDADRGTAGVLHYWEQNVIVDVEE